MGELDDNNAIAVASRLAQMLKNQDRVKTVISSHHTLFFNVLCNELGNAIKVNLSKGEASGSYDLRTMFGDTARYYHVAMLKEIKQAADSDALYGRNLARMPNPQHSETERLDHGPNWLKHTEDGLLLSNS